MNLMKTKFLCGLALVALGVTSCKDNAVFDQNTYNQLVLNSFPVKNVDPAQSWTTVETATAEVTLNGQTGTTYKVNIYEQNPIDYTGTLTKLAGCNINNGETANLNFSYRPAQTYVYVTLFDKDNYMTVYPAAIENGTMNLNIGQVTIHNARRRGIASSFKFADAPNDADFKTTTPDDALLASQYGDATKNSIHNYKLAETTDVQNLNFYNGNFALYVSGTKNIIYTQPGDGSKNMYFYILPGAHLTFKQKAMTQNSSGNFKMYVCNGATVTFEKGLQSYMELYNRGTVEVKGGYKPGIYGGGIFYNQGTFTINGADAYYTENMSIKNPLTLNNSASQFINEGTLNVGGVILEGSSHFINFATVTASDATIVNSNHATWVNNGTYTTGNFKYTAGSTDVINNCKLTVTEKFYIGLAETDENGFKLNSGASVLTKDFEFKGPGFIFMGSNALFKVTNTAKFAINKDIYGIYGPESGEHAIFQAKAIERLNSWETNQGFSANYFQRLYVACNSHFPFGYSDKSAVQQSNGEIGTQPYYRLDAAGGASMTTYNGANVTLSDEGCGTAYTGTPHSGVLNEKPLGFRFLFEDNYPDAGDYDFNDVVLKVTPEQDANNAKKVKVTVNLEATGASKNNGTAIRLKGVTAGMLSKYERTSAALPAPPSELGNYNNNIPDGDFTTSKDPNDQSSLVILLCKDVHWALNPIQRKVGGVQRFFYNTPLEGWTNYGRADVKTITYEFTFNNESDAQKLLSEATYDAFIVTSYGGGFWETHTVQNGNKDAIVLHPEVHISTYQEYRNTYVNNPDIGNLPWAVMVPSTVAYPLEGRNIKTAYSDFEGWAQDHTTKTDWYLRPGDGHTFPLSNLYP